MGKGYLMDTNAVIDYLGDKLPDKGSLLMDKLPVTISIVTRIEVLGWYGINDDQLKRLTSFMEDAIIYPLEDVYVEHTIKLRQQSTTITPSMLCPTVPFREIPTKASSISLSGSS